MAGPRLSAQEIERSASLTGCLGGQLGRLSSSADSATSASLDDCSAVMARVAAPAPSLAERARALGPSDGLLTCHGFSGHTGTLARCGGAGGGAMTDLRHGRPVLAAAFAEAEVAALRDGATRVAVLVCGNAGIARDCHRLASMFSNRSFVRFECHSEAFQF